MNTTAKQLFLSFALLLMLQMGAAQNKFQKVIFQSQDTTITSQARLIGLLSVKRNDNEYLSMGGNTAGSNFDGWGYNGKAPLIASLIDSSGNLKWAKEIVDTIFYGYIQGITLTPNGGMIAVGKIPSATSVDGYAIGLDRDGNFMWAKEMDAGFNNGDEELYNIVPLLDGSFIILGRVELADGAAVPLYIKLDATGNILWSKKVTNDPILQMYDMIATPDSGFAAAGDYGLFMKFDKQGNMQWKQRLDWEYPSQRYHHLISTPDGGYLLHGAIDSMSQQGHGVLVRKIKSSGEEQWTKKYTFSGPPYSGAGNNSSRPFIAQNGDYIFSGKHRPAGIFTYKAYVVRMDTSGTIRWVKDYGLGCKDDGVFVDGSYINKLGLGHVNKIVQTYETKGKNLLSFGVTGRFMKYKPSDEFRGYVLYSSMVLKTGGDGVLACYDQTPVVSTTPLIQTYIVPSLVVSDISLTSVNLTQTTVSLFYSDSIVCSETKLFHAAFTASDTAICAGQSIDFSSTGTYTPKTISNYKWTFAGATVTAGKDTLANPTGVIYPTPGIYQVTLEVSDECDDTYFLVKDSYISVGPALPVITGNTTLCSGERVTLMLSDSSTLINSRYLWNTGSTSASLTIYPLDTATYCVTVTDSTECSASTCVFVTVDKNCCGDAFVPSAFSPNSDGSNDVLYANVRCAKEMEFKIFDRWGNTVFESTNAATGWDGKYKEKEMDPAVFVYYLQAVLSNGDPVNTKGNISLVK